MTGSPIRNMYRNVKTLAPTVSGISLSWPETWRHFSNPLGHSHQKHTSTPGPVLVGNGVQRRKRTIRRTTSSLSSQGLMYKGRPALQTLPCTASCGVASRQVSFCLSHLCERQCQMGSGRDMRSTMHIQHRGVCIFSGQWLRWAGCSLSSVF